MGQDIQFVVDTTAFKGASETNIILDKYYDSHGNMLVVLIGPETDSADLANLTKVHDYGDWIHEVPKDDEYLYAVGLAPVYYYQASSWKEAKINALIEMAHQISAEIKSLQKYEGNNVYKTIVEEGDVVLKKWQVIARKFDSSNNTFNVLIRMPILE